jgi:two-component system response regulator DctR
VLKEGAIDFLQKPISGDELLTKLGNYFKISSNLWTKKQHLISVQESLSSLTSKEYLIMQHLYRGESNKDIAEQLGNSVRTVELRRAAIYDKLRVKSVVDMVRLLEGINL